jgi:hypothetical protein
LENNAPEIPEPERNMFQRAMALWMKRLDPALEVETRGESDTDLESNMVIPMWQQLGEQKQRLILEYKERAVSLNSAEALSNPDIADKAGRGTAESLQPFDQQLQSRSISEQGQNSPGLDIRMVSESEKEFEEKWKAEIDRSKAPHLNDSDPPESVIGKILDFTRRRPSQILPSGFEHDLARAYGRLAANNLDRESEKAPHPLDHQDLLDMKSVVKTQLLGRVSKDLDGIAVRGTGRPCDLEGTIEQRIDDSLQIKQDEIIRMSPVIAFQFPKAAEEERDKVEGNTKTGQNAETDRIEQTTPEVHTDGHPDHVAAQGAPDDQSHGYGGRESEESATGAQEQLAERSSVPVAARERLNVKMIRDWIFEEGWTNQTLAKELNTSERTISSIRNDGSYHGLDILTKLANRMNKDVSDLFLP